MNHLRHQDLFDASKMSVTMIGAGGIGASAGLCLAKMGIRSLRIIDNDDITEENLPTQFHRLSDVGRHKTHALKETIELFSDDCEVYANVNTVDEFFNLSDRVVVSAVDSIKARKDIWAAAHLHQVDHYIDARMAAEEFHLYYVDMSNNSAVNKYNVMLGMENDASIPDLRCTAKATMYCSLIAGGIIGATVKKIITGETIPSVLVYNIASNIFLAN